MQIFKNWSIKGVNFEKKLIETI